MISKTPLYFYNSLSHKKELLAPINQDQVKVYSCGPTIYNHVHIGNLRTFLVEDVLVRFLKKEGYSPFYVMNLTDVDDKSIKGAHAKGVSLKEFTQEYEKSFFEDLEELNFLKADAYPKATEFIDEMIETIGILLKKGLAYQGEDGSIYYSIEKFDDYGSLSGLLKEDLKVGASKEGFKDEYSKEDASDFVLWKSYKAEDGDVFWESPYGKGRPGWHLECSVMSYHYLGASFDIHCGGVDNKFPHHENEIAQSKEAFGGDFAKMFFHISHLKSDAQKMSKSLGNIYRLKDLLEKGYSAEEIRYALLSAHYRKELYFSMEVLEQSRKALNRLWNLMREFQTDLLKKDKNQDSSFTKKELLIKADEDLKRVLADDLNTPGAYGVVFSLVKEFVKDSALLSLSDKEGFLNFILNWNEVFKCFNLPKEKEDNLSQEESELLQQRFEARQNKDFKKSDELRDALALKGIEVLDSKEGQTWQRKINSSS